MFYWLKEFAWEIGSKLQNQEKSVLPKKKLIYTLYKYNNYCADHCEQCEMKIKKLTYPLGQASHEVF